MFERHFEVKFFEKIIQRFVLIQKYEYKRC